MKFVTIVCVGCGEEMTKIAINTIELSFPYYLNCGLTMILLLWLTK